MTSTPCLVLLLASAAMCSASYGQTSDSRITSSRAANMAADPRVSSWMVAPSARYARIYETDAARESGTSVITWSRGRGVQSTPSYAGVMQVSSSADWVYVRSSGLGYHVMGPWYLNAAHTRGFPNFPANRDVLVRFPRVPRVPDVKTLTRRGRLVIWSMGWRCSTIATPFPTRRRRGATRRQ